MTMARMDARPRQSPSSLGGVMDDEVSLTAWMQWSHWGSG
jgi:hypothetical protein